MTKELTKFQIATVKRTHKSVASLLKRNDKLSKIKEEIEKEIQINQDIIDKFEAPIIDMTGGLTSSEYLNHSVVSDVPMENENDSSTGFDVATPTGPSM